MNSAKPDQRKRIGRKCLHLALCALLVFQTLGLPRTAQAASAFYFRGFGAENVTANTFAYATSDASVSGTTVTMASGASEGTAVGLITLDEEGHDISTSVDLGGLEISFSTLATVTEEGENGTENDVPTVDISFCSTSDNGSEISSVHLAKPDTTVSGGVTLSSGASIPAGTRSIFIYLNGASANGENTVVFSGSSLVIRDAAAPSCAVNYNTAWTNQDITVTISAADGDSGLEGIYYNGSKVTSTSPYTFTVSANNTSFTAYSMDYAGKQSEIQSVTVTNIDKTTPTAPSQVVLSKTGWSNTDVSVLMPALGASSGSPERYVYQTGSSAWADLPGTFAISAEGNTILRVAVEDAAGNRSSYAQATVSIDKQAPVIGDIVETVGSGTSSVSVSATDVGLSGIAKFAYAAGEQDASYFTTGGTNISGNAFTVSVGGAYTIYAADNAGNSALKTTTLYTAPVFAALDNITIDEDETRNVPLTIADAESGLADLIIHVSTTNDALLSNIVVNQTSEAASLDITPAANQSGGPVTVTVTAEDPSGHQTSRQFTVTVVAVNDPPVANDDNGVLLDEDTSIEIDVLANDADTADGDTLTIVDTGSPAHGTTLNVLGKIRYTPDADFAGTDSFVYEISDGNGGTDTATVTVTVGNVNDAPVAAADSASTSEDTAVLIAVLANDTDIDTGTDPEEAISLDSFTQGAHGSTREQGGEIFYTPETNYNGTDTFTYTITDAHGLTAEATVTITISPEPDDPTFSGLEDEYTINEDAQNAQITFAIQDVETPNDSVMLQAASLDETRIEQGGLVLSGLGDGDPAVTLSVTPLANQNGDVTVRFTLGDGFTSVSRDITIHILPVNDAPRVTNDTVTYQEDSEYVDISIATLLANDSDVESDALFYNGNLTQPAYGTIELIDAGTLRYTPLADYEGTVSFTYAVSDGQIDTTATCTLKVTGVNDAPTITLGSDTYDTDEDTLLTIPFTMRDNESSAADLSVIAASSDDDIVTTDGITIVNNGDGTGEIRILPSADANGSVTIIVTVSDGEAQTESSFALNVAAVQDAPVATDDTIYVHYTRSRVFGVLVNDHDVDGDVLSVSGYTADLPGTLTFDETTNQFTYRPAVGENGTATFTYTVYDGTDSATGTVTLNVTTETHDPVITAINSQYVNEDGTVSGIAFSVSDEDTGDSATISVTSGDENLLPNDAEHIVLTSLGNGNYSLALTPEADASGTVYVTVTATDSTSRTGSATFRLRILALNDAPEANEDTFTIDEDGSASLTVMANDTDPEGDAIWITSFSTPAHGWIGRSGSGYVYYPYSDWNGTETLTYGISDGRASAYSTVTIIVNSVNDDPVAWDDYCAIPNTAEEQRSISVLYNDHDPDTGDVVHLYQIVTPPQYGNAVIETNGTITYTRNSVSPNGNGADSFVYRVIDRETATGDYRYDDATVHIGEVFNNYLYTYGRTVVCNEDADPFNFNISVSNPHEVTYTLTIDTETTLGTFTVLDNHTVTFAPAPNQYGTASISYTVSQVDGEEGDTGTIWLRVYPVNDLPVIDSAPEQVTMQEDASGGSSFDVTFHDPDCATDDLYFYVYTKSATTSAPIPFQADYTVQRTETGVTVTMQTAENVNGTGELVVGISDGQAYDEQTIPFTVTPVDDAPVVADVAMTIKEDSSICFASPGSDSEADGDATHESIATADAPQHGTATIRASQTICYEPDENFNGTEEFYVTITDDTTAALYSRAKVTITVLPVNDQPELYNLSYYQTTLEDTAKNVTLTVTDVDNDMTGSGSYTLTSGNQSLVKNANISISHGTGDQMIIRVLPEANAYGTVKINVVASDGALSAEGAFELKIIPVNDVPVAVDDTASVDEVVSTGKESTPPKTSKVMNLLANDSDVEDTTPKIVSISDVVNGTVVNSGSGNVTVSADGDFNGDVTFTYTVMDRAGATASATGTLTINPVNDPPRAKDDSITISEDARPDINVLGNDTDPDGGPLSITGVTTPSHGSATISGTKVSYVPVKDYNGSDSFTYTVSDGNGGEATATVRITLKPVNDAPEISKHSSNPDEWVMQEDTPKSFNFVVYDAESAVSTLIIKITSLNEELIKTSEISLTTNSEGYKTIHVTPEPNVYGTVPVRFHVSDGLLSTTVDYNIVIESVNDAPVVSAPDYEMKEDTELDGAATATDADNDIVTFSLMTEPAHGDVTVAADGKFHYVPDRNFNGEDSFLIAADDGNEENNIGTKVVTITVKPEGDAPVAADDTLTVDEDTPTQISVLANDKDEDLDYGDKISILSVTSPAHGTAVSKDGGIFYTPTSNYNGSDTFRYTITDLDGKISSASVVITIQRVNDAPSGGNDTATVSEDGSVVIDATANDDVDETTNPNYEDVLITGVDDPAHGTAVVNAGDKTITYSPDANWFSPVNEPDVFYYDVEDSSGLTGRFSISVTVTSVNDLPVITPADLPDVTTNEDTTSDAITFAVSDVENTASDLTVTATHNNSTLLPAVTVTKDANGNCSFTVTPKLNKVGSATFTVTVTDKNGGTDSDTFAFTVTPVNDPPAAVDDAFSVSETGTVTYDVLANDDVDTQSGNGGDTLTLLSFENPSSGSASIVGNQLRFVPDATRSDKTNYTVQFNYTMQDASLAQSTAKATVTVTPVNDAPVISTIANVTGVPEDAADGTGEISFTVTDEEDIDDQLTITTASGNTTLFPLANIIVTNPTDDPTGSLRTVKVIPAANQFGTANITLTVRDLQGKTASRTFSVTVVAVNDAPANGNKSYTVTEDVEKQLDVLTGIDPDYTTAPQYLNITGIATEPAHGTVRISTDKKTIYYKTEQDGNSPDSFQYTLHDDFGSADYTFTISITVTPVNDAPKITYTGQSNYTVNEGVPVTDIPFIVTDVDNVTFAGGVDPVEVTLSAKSSNTILLKNGIHIDTLEGNNRDIDLQPYQRWNGTTTVTITAADPAGLKGTASFTLTVNNVNDLPVAVDDTFEIPEDQTTSVDVLENDTDNDLLTNPDAEQLKVHEVTDNDENATITIASDELSVLVTPNANYNGPVSFTYLTKDAHGGISESATVTITVLQVNDAPTPQNDAAETQEDTAVEIAVLENDTDMDQTKVINASPLDETLSVLLDESGLNAPAHGKVTTDGTTILYTPDDDYNGEDRFDYYCYDGEAKTKASVSVAIAQVNDAPIAVNDSAETDEDTNVSVNVLTNDTDVDTIAALNEDVLHDTASFILESYAIVGTAHGTVTQDGAVLEFDPAQDFYGVQKISYVMSDSHGLTATGLLTIDVGSENDAPVAFDDEMRADEDHAASVNVLTNDTDVDDGDTKAFAGFTEPTTSLPGAFTTAENGDILFTPDENYNGTFTIGYQMRDAGGLTATATITVIIDAVNDKPVADDGTATTPEDTRKAIDVAQLISDADILTNDDAITVTVLTAGNPAHGEVDVDGTVITYTPEDDFNGADAFTYTVTDKAGETDTGTIDITVTPVNDNPTAEQDSKTTAEDTAAEILPLANDWDIDADESLNLLPAATLSVSSVTDGAHGTATTDGTIITYTPDENYNGPDELTYVLTDGKLTGEAKVMVTVTQVNDPIIAENDTAETNDEDTVSIDVLANDTDVDTEDGLNQNALHLRSSFTFTEVSEPAHGTAVVVSGKIEYTPEDRYAGDDSFQYTVSDGHGSSDTANVSITVLSVNDPPETPVVSKPAEGDRAGTGSTVEVAWSGFDIDNDPLSYRLEYYDGKAWVLIAEKLTDTTYSFDIPDSLPTTKGLKFRVNASDAEYTSEYGYSGAMQVDKDAPKDTVVSLRTADGRAYTAGVWTNQTVTISATSSVDDSKVTYYYAMDEGESAAGTGMDVVTGVHTVTIVAKDEYGNTETVGSYLARVDKQPPAVPEIKESVGSARIVLTLTLHTDPGGSGNNKLTLPDGSTVKAEGSPTYSAVKNGEYGFVLTDVAGNRRTFTHTVSTVDTSKPAITIATGGYRIGTTTQDTITAALTFTDAEYDVIARGYQISVSRTPTGTYKTYDGALKLSDAGSYYIHAYAKNAFGLTAYETFGPFIIEAVEAPAATPAPQPETGDVFVTKEDLESIPGDTTAIRLPGQEWGDTLTLNDVSPGTYLVEAMDKDGNVRTIEVRVTMRDIVARSLRSAADKIQPAAYAIVALAMAVIVLLLLASNYNVTLSVFGVSGGEERKVRTLRRIKFRKKELVVRLDDKHVRGGELVTLKLAKHLTKRMRTYVVVMTIRGDEVLRAQIPEDMDRAFESVVHLDR